MAIVRLIGSLVVLAGFLGAGAQAPVGSGSAASLSHPSGETITNSGSMAMATELGGQSLTVGISNSPTVAFDTGTLPRGGGPLTQGVPASLVLIGILAFMMSRTLFGLRRLSPLI
jgi:hypothetical protein